jgi:hypothetical protein
MGFCIFNNVAIGARYARTIGYDRVFIVDFDAHHGNGTQHIFEEDDSVFYFSTHQHPYYPDTGKDMERGKGKGAGFTYNVPIPAGSGNKDYLMVYQDILPGLLHRFRPDIVLVSAGYDIHERPPRQHPRLSRRHPPLSRHPAILSVLSRRVCVRADMISVPLRFGQNHDRGNAQRVVGFFREATCTCHPLYFLSLPLRIYFVFSGLCQENCGVHVPVILSTQNTKYINIGIRMFV